MGKVALNDPVSGFVRVALLRPPIEPSPHEVVEGGERLPTNDVAIRQLRDTTGVQFVQAATFKRTMLRASRLICKIKRALGRMALR